MEANHSTVQQHSFHAHCERCIKVNMCIVPPVPNSSCSVVSCELNCGFRFHACKVIEHRLLCSNEKVPCINAGNGCPVILVRSQQAQHLEVCPASVVICTMEWNRWPLCSMERRKYPIHVLNPHAIQDQLDVALALRDQRMLKELKYPSRIRQILRNSLSCFPAVPFPLRSESSGGTKEWDSSLTTVCGDASQGVLCSGCSTTGGRTDAIVSDTVTSCGEFQSGWQSGKTGCDSANIIPWNEQNKSNKNCDTKMFKEVNIHESENLNCENHDKCGAKCESVSHQDTCPIFNSAFKSKAEYSTSESDLNKMKLQAVHSAESAAAVIPPPPPPIPCVITSLGLDLTIECITRYQNKPRNMYTFLCVQEFRRDEYSWHYRNVHGDIHGGLNGWLEHRCPLAHYGCMYSLRRLYPSTKEAYVIHSEVLESFGVKLREDEHPGLGSNDKKIGQTKTNNDNRLKDDKNATKVLDQPLQLCELPFEVLRHICNFLDSFSLCNFALTCHRLREVCCSLLDKRGIVVQQWKKNSRGSKNTWTIAYKRWFFSTAFTPVKSWGFEEKDHMSNHLKSCGYFNRNVIPKPYFHMLGFQVEPSPELHGKLTGSTPNSIGYS